MRKEKSDLLFCTVTLKDHPFIVCYQGMYAFSIEFGSLWMAPLKKLALRIILASVTTKVLLQRGKKMEVIWCQDPTESDTLQPCLRNLDGSISNVCSRALTLNQWLAFYWPSEKHLGDYTFQNSFGSPGSTSQWFCLQSPEFCVEGIQSVITHCDKWTFRVTMWKSRYFLLRNLMLNMQLFFVYSYILIHRIEHIFKKTE